MAKLSLTFKEIYKYLRIFLMVKISIFLMKLLARVLKNLFLGTRTIYHI